MFWIGLLVLGLSDGSPAEASPNAGDSPLIDAVTHADTAAVRALLGAGVDVNAAAPDGATALHWAVHRDDLTLVELLIDAGADVLAANRYGVQPIALAAENGHAAILERLLEAGADPNTPLPGGETALMTAARGGDTDAVRVLLVNGADPNAKESLRGQTALMWAAARNKRGRDPYPRGARRGTSAPAPTIRRLRDGARLFRACRRPGSRRCCSRSVPVTSMRFGHCSMSVPT